jgi:hypothetical protein
MRSSVSRSKGAVPASTCPQLLDARRVVGVHRRAELVLHVRALTRQLHRLQPELRRAPASARPRRHRDAREAGERQRTVDRRGGGAIERRGAAPPRLLGEQRRKEEAGDEQQHADRDAAACQQRHTGEQRGRAENADEQVRREAEVLRLHPFVHRWTRRDVGNLEFVGVVVAHQ